jgi:alpha-N-arabinofuranosidase
MFAKPTALTTLIGAAVILAAGAMALAAPRATIAINATAAGRSENHDMWGIFLEDINNCVDGGLYAQLIRNPDFQNDVPPSDCKVVHGQWELPSGQFISPPHGGALYGWTPLEANPATLKVIKTAPLSAAHPRSMRIIASQAGAGVVNSGYWGMNIRSGHNYKLSFYARTAVHAPQGVSAMLIGRNGIKLSPAESINVSGSSWKKYTLNLHATADDARGRLAIMLSRRGSVGLTLALLFPENSVTGQPELFRPDLLKLLQNLHPGFLRFPGGNYVEGISNGDSYNWAQTIGPMKNRPGHFNCWGYRNTDGFGYLQYLELCQAISAVPVYGTSAGMPLGYFYPTNPVPSATGAALKPFIRRMLSAVAFANSSAVTRWGALRAKYGHPKPFDLRYVEIGNENGGPIYVKNAKPMALALKTYFPDVIPIRTAWSARLAKIIPLGDEHYYASPDMFYVDSTEFNTRPRNTPVRSFVGEYAVIGDVGKFGDLRGALAEAAYMTGMERNCDVVRMASYAPLFQNTDGYQWKPDLIEFNTAHAFGRSSYWVQWMFSNNRPDVVYPTRVHAIIKPSISGRIAFITHSCSAQFADIRITRNGRSLMATGPGKKNGGLKQWYNITWHGGWGANWKTRNGVLSQTAAGAGENTSAVGNPSWANYTLRLRMKKLSGPGGISLQVRRDPGGLNAAEIQFGGPGNKTFALKAVHDRAATVLAQKSGMLKTGKWYNVKIVLRGQDVAAYLDGHRALAATVHDTPPRFFADAGFDKTSRNFIIKVTNTTGNAMPTTVHIAALTGIKPRGRVLTLTGKPTEENTYAHPLRITPRKSVFDHFAKSFTYTFKPNSLTVLRVRTLAAPGN